MANARYYSSIAAATNLQVTANPGDTSIQVASSLGWPGSFPFIISLDYGAANEELALATSGGPNVFQVTRSYDGTSASTHNAGAVVRHVSSAIDFTDSRTHEASNSGVHGITGAFVDTASSQTLSNKTLNSSTINNSTLGGTIAASGATFTGGTFTSPTITGTVGGNQTFSGNVAVTGTTTLNGAVQVNGNPVLVQRTATTDSAYRARITGDTTFRFITGADGKQSWGPGGAAATDTDLARTGVGALTLTGSLTTTANLAATGTLTAGSLIGSIGGNPAFTGTPTFAPTTAIDTAIIPDTVANGWSLDGAHGRKSAGVTTIRVNVERVGGDISSNASGNITDAVIGTLAAGWRPLDGTMITNYDMSSRAEGSVSIGNNGVVTIKSLSAGNTIGLADTVNFSLTFASST